MSIATKIIERNMVGPRIALLAKESVAPSSRSSAGWMPESMGKWSIGVKRRLSATMRKASYRTLSMRRDQTGAQYTAVE